MYKIFIFYKRTTYNNKVWVIYPYCNLDKLIYKKKFYKYEDITNRF